MRAAEPPKGYDARQAGILSDRYLDVILGDLTGTALLLLQAPLLAAAIAGVFVNLARDSLTLYFVLALSAFFLGAVNAAREIVKERALYLRERMFNLSPASYLVSKYRVQLMLVVLQAVLLTGLVSVFVRLEIRLYVLGPILVLTALAGTSVGLLISSFVATSDKAVALVPLVVIPQILFSDAVVGSGRLDNWTGVAQKLMPVHWSYEVLTALRAQSVEYGEVFTGLLVVSGLILACFALSLARLRRLSF